MNMDKKRKLHLVDSKRWERNHKQQQKRYTYKSHCKHFILDMSTVQECYQFMKLLKQRLTHLKGDK